MISIKRKRFVIVKDNKYIFCGLARHYQFKSMDDIGDTAVKTYLSEKKARASFISSWWKAEALIESGSVRFVEVTESIEQMKGA